MKSALSPCARDYLSVLENPFSGKTSCIPVDTNFPTRKFSVFSRGVFNTGSSAFGFVMFSPQSSFMNDSVAVYFSGTTYGGTTFTASGTGVYSAYTNSDYTGASLGGDELSARLVGAGLRVRNVTPMLSRGGSCVGVESPNHINLTNYTFANVMAFDEAARITTTRDIWSSVVHHPQDDDDFDFLASTGSPGSIQFYYLGFCADAPASSPQTYEYECYAAYEAKGSFVRGLTPSFTDPMGMAAIQNTVMSVEARRPKENRIAWVAGLLAKASRAVNAVGEVLAEEM